MHLKGISRYSWVAGQGKMLKALVIQHAKRCRISAREELFYKRSYMKIKMLAWLPKSLKGAGRGTD